MNRAEQGIRLFVGGNSPGTTTNVSSNGRKPGTWWGTEEKQSGVLGQNNNGKINGPV